MLKWHGVVGAAIAWTIRVTLDAILLFAAAGWLARTPFLHWPRFVALVGAMAAILAASAAPFSLSPQDPICDRYSAAVRYWSVVPA